MVSAKVSLTTGFDSSQDVLGFTPVGVYGRVGFKHGSWYDVGWWQRPLRDAPAEPREPVPWSPT